MFVFLSGFSLQVMCCCCNKLCLMLWSRLLWKLTGPPLCLIHLGEYYTHIHTHTHTYNMDLNIIKSYIFN